MISPARRKSLIFPREHGAWGILLIPLITGAAAGLMAGGNALTLVPLTIAVLALFWLRTPVESWVGGAPVKARTADELGLVRGAAGVLAAVAVAAAVWLFWGGRNLPLLWIGLVAGAAFLMQAMLRRQSRSLAQIVGATGLTAVAPAAFYVVTGGFQSAAWTLWLANLLFAANQIQFVQLRIRAARATTTPEKLALGSGFVLSQVGLVLALVGACRFGFLPWFAALAFVPILYRGFAWFWSGAQPLAIHALGKRELNYACMFAALLTAAFYYRI